MPGDIVQSGIIISNSEVGLGSVNIQPLVYRLVCSNGMVVNDAQTRRNHVGRVNEASENYQLYSEKTLEADDKAFAMKIQDTVRAVVQGGPHKYHRCPRYCQAGQQGLPHHR